MNIHTTLRRDILPTYRYKDKKEMSKVGNVE